MTKANSINDLKNLTSGEKFYCIDNGRISGYIYVGVHPVSTMQNSIVCINDSNYSTGSVIHENDLLHNRKVFLTGAYSSHAVGQIMIDQLKDKTKAIKEIYLDKQP